jgi:hypothetical protein
MDEGWMGDRCKGGWMIDGRVDGWMDGWMAMFCEDGSKIYLFKIGCNTF